MRQKIHVTLNFIHRKFPVIYYLIKNTPGVKKEGPRTKTGLAEKDLKSNGQTMAPSFDQFESFGHDELTVKHCYFRC